MGSVSDEGLTPSDIMVRMHEKATDHRVRQEAREGWNQVFSFYNNLLGQNPTRTTIISSKGSTLMTKGPPTSPHLLEVPPPLNITTLGTKLQTSKLLGKQ